MTLLNEFCYKTCTANLILTNRVEDAFITLFYKNGKWQSHFYWKSLDHLFSSFQIVTMKLSCF